MKLLLIDDDNFFAAQLQRIFRNVFEIEHTWTGEEGLERAKSDPPDLIMLDVGLPGADGYTICRQLEEDAETQDIPVIFISSHEEISYRLKGFDAGGEDYILKPPLPDMLRRRISVTLRNKKRQEEVLHSARQATDVAMAAMTSAGDAGLVLDFMRVTARESSFAKLAELTLEFLQNLGLDAVVQIRSGNSAISRSQRGECTALESSVMQHMTHCDRIVNLSRKSAFNYPHVTIIVNNMARDEPLLSGRIKDVVTMIAEALEIRTQSLDSTLEAINRGDQLLSLLRQNTQTLRSMEASYREQRTQSARILSQLVVDLEDSFVFLGLTESQEKFLQEMARDATDAAQALYSAQENLSLDMGSEEIVRALGEGLDATLQRELLGAAEGAGEIELF